MNVVKDLQSLIQLMHSHDEVIIFPIGDESQQLLDFLRYADFLNRVCCIATTKVLRGFEQKFIHEIPVIPFENLVHFRETALIIVSAHDADIDAVLTRFGFKAVFIHEGIHAQIKNELQKMYSTGQVMMWYMRRFDEKITAMEYRIDEQNGISKVNTKAFAEYRNAFRGKDVVIAGNGPTLNYYKPIPNAIHICLNRAWMREDIGFDYLFASDGYANEFAEVKIEKGFDRIQNGIFIGKFLVRWKLNWLEMSEEFSLGRENIRCFYINVEAVGQPVYQDICNNPLVHFGSVAFEAMHFALFTYPKRIFLVGCDTSRTGHFYKYSVSESEKNNPGMLVHLMKVGYARMKMFAKHYYPNTEIISINPVGLRGLFKDVYTDEYKASLAENSSMTPSFSGGGGIE